MTWLRSRTGMVVLALAVIILAVGLAVLCHLLLGFANLKIAVAQSSVEDRQAATALMQHLATEHPRLRVKAVLEKDRLETAAGLDRGDAELALVRSDAAAQDGQTLVILRRDAVAFIAPGGSHVDSVSKLKGSTVALLDGRRLDQRLLDTILDHFGIPRGSVRREVLTVDQLAEAAKERRFGALFVVAPAISKTWLSVYTALRKGPGHPKTFAVDEAGAIAKEHPELDTIDLPKGTFVGSLPAPDDDITTLSVSHRLVARSELPEWLAGEITREVLTNKPKLAALNSDLAGIEAPDTDEKNQAMPIHPGAAAYLSGSLPSLSDQLQNVLYWLGLAVSALGSLSAAGMALVNRFRPPPPPPSRVMRLLEIWIAVRAVDLAELDALEAETDSIVAEAIREEAHDPSDSAELRLCTMLVGHVRDTIGRRRIHAAGSAAMSPAI